MGEKKGGTVPNCNITNRFSLNYPCSLSCFYKLPLSQKRERLNNSQDRRGEPPVFGLPLCDFNEKNGEQRIWNCLRSHGGFLFATRRVVRDRDR